MALQIWLPLDGNLENLGLTDTTINNNGATIDNNGKIGKCYYFNNKYLWGNLDYSSFDTEFSVCFWYKITTAFSGNKHIVCLANTYGWASLIFTCAATANNVFSFNIGNNSTSERKITCPYITGQWQHICFTFNNKVAKVYINGILLTTATYTINPNWSNIQKFGIGGTPSGQEVCTTLFVNDVRIYNHALSYKEVKEIAKGLVLHYPLNKLLANLFKGYPYEITLNNYLNRGSFTLFTNCLSIDPSSSNNLNKKYTISFDACSPNGTTALLLYNSNGTPRYFYYSTTLDSALESEWKHYTYTFTNTDRGSGNAVSHPVEIYMPSQMGGKVRGIKIEEGEKATPWIPNISDSLYAAAGYASGIVYDCSGYLNNGIEVGTITGSADTPRYRTSYYFDGIDSAIQVPYNATVFLTNFTINLWFKKTELGSKGYETLFGGPSGFEMDTRNGNSTTLSLYMTGTRGGNAFSSFSFGEWYMVTMVNDGTNELYYINGELKKTIEKKSMPTGNYFIGAWSTSSKQNFKGYISDFRIYCTALSAADVKALYTDAGYVDKNGNFHAYEFVEE